VNIMDKLEYSVTFATITPESAEHGDFEETGFHIESITFDCFGELVDYLERNGYYYWSNSNDTGWLSTGWQVDDYTTMTEIEYSIHAKNDRAQRYMEKAYGFNKH